MSDMPPAAEPAPVTPSDELAVWLRATIEGDLVRALALPRGPWHVKLLGDKGYPQRISNPRAILIAQTYEGGGQTPVADHIARHDTDDTIARCEAELREIDLIEATPHVRVHGDEWWSCSQARDEDGDPACYDEDRQGRPCDCGRDERVGALLRVKASGYRHRPGYRKEWRP